MSADAPLRIPMDLPDNVGREWDSPAPEGITTEAQRTRDLCKSLGEIAEHTQREVLLRNQGPDRGTVVSYDYETRPLDMFDRIKKHGFKVVLMQEQFRFPRSKKKRIRKKWAKDPRNFRPWKDKPHYHWFQKDFQRSEAATGCPCHGYQAGAVEHYPIIHGDTKQPATLRIEQGGKLSNALRLLLYGRHPWVDPRINVLQTVHDEVDIQMIPEDALGTVAHAAEETFARVRQQIAYGLGISPERLAKHPDRASSEVLSKE